MLGFFNSPSRVHQKSVFKYECKFKREHASLTIKATDITTEMRLNLDGQIQYCPNEGIEPPTFWYYGSRLTIITTNRIAAEHGADGRGFKPRSCHLFLSSPQKEERRGRNRREGKTGQDMFLPEARPPLPFAPPRKRPPARRFKGPASSAPTGEPPAPVEKPQLPSGRLQKRDRPWPPPQKLSRNQNFLATISLPGMPPFTPAQSPRNRQIDGNKSGNHLPSFGFDHISRNPPVLIRTPKLTRLEPA